MKTFVKYTPQKFDECVNLHEVEQLAINKLTDNSLSYYYSGAGDEETLKENKDAFRRIHLNPRVLVDVSHIDTSCNILGQKISMPICIAPSALHKLASEKGENDTASAAHKLNTLMILSTLSSVKLEDVAESNKTGLRWFQLYVLKDREFTANIIKRAQKSGFKAIVLTVDAPILGSRERDQRVKFSLPKEISYENLTQTVLDSKQITQEEIKHSSSQIFNLFLDKMDPSLNWEVIKWIRSITTLPLILKGVHRADDAVLAAEMGVNGIIVSNHGGRQLDTVLSGVELLIPIAQALKKYRNIEIYVDGGIRRGTDVFKCLALGAKAVFLGRPILYGLACEGENGVRRVIEIIYKELVICMKLCGCRKVSEIGRDMVILKRTKF